MTLGWPRSEPRQRPRLALNAVLHWEIYDRSEEDEALHSYDRVMRETGIYRGRQVPVAGIHEGINDYGWLEHSARRASQAIRTDLRAVLRAQGFDLS
jgi:hypothetical protein